jgi:hypothetical protein
MNCLRAFFVRHRVMAFVVVMAALCMKVLVPSGYMIGQDSKVLTVQICYDGSGHSLTKQLVIPMKGEPSDSSGKQGKGDCPFSSLSMALVSGADQALLGLALAFILALGFAPTRGVLPRPFFYLRPPLRGPPALL